jgi:hypothetical protein
MIAGDPNASAKGTTRCDARATNGSVVPLCSSNVSSTYSIPTARVPLQRLKSYVNIFKSRRRTHTQK